MSELGIKTETNRSDLSKELLLKTPYVVYLGLSSSCNFKCNFCVHGNAESEKKMQPCIMKKELALKCIDEISLFKTKLKRLSFTDNGEPLLNKNIVDIVEYAVSKDVADEYAIVTNGSLLDEKMSAELLKAGITRFDVSIYGLNDNDYLQFVNGNASFTTILNNVRLLYNNKGSAKIVVKIADVVCNTEAKKKLFMDYFSGCADVICIEHAAPIWHDVDTKGVEYDNINIYGSRVIRKKVCPAPFYNMAIHANGIVTPCCNEWMGSLKMGDVNYERVDEIWGNNKYLNHYKFMAEKGIDCHSVCKNCGWPHYVALDNLDSDCELILERVNNKYEV